MLRILKILQYFALWQLGVMLWGSSDNGIPETLPKWQARDKEWSCIPSVVILSELDHSMFQLDVLTFVENSDSSEYSKLVSILLWLRVLRCIMEGSDKPQFGKSIDAKCEQSWSTVSWWGQLQKIAPGEWQVPVKPHRWKLGSKRQNPGVCEWSDVSHKTIWKSRFLDAGKLRLRFECQTLKSKKRLLTRVASNFNWRLDTNRFPRWTFLKCGYPDLRRIRASVECEKFKSSEKRKARFAQNINCGWNTNRF
jgi:hypothetical protein